MYRLKTIKLLSLLLLSSLCFSMLFSCSGVKFKVEFIVDGEVYKTVSTKDETEIKIPPNPQKEGFDFEGWYLDDGRWKDPFTANSLLDTPISEDMVLKVYARFIPVTEGSSDFLFKACDGGYEVIGYTGDNPIVTIPSTYKNQPVLAIGTDNSEDRFSDNEKIEEIIIPNSVTQISAGAFRNCINLTTVTIPDSVTNIGYAVFSGCENITVATVPATQLLSFSLFPKNNLTTVVIRGGTSISAYNMFFSTCNKLISLTIEEGVTSIGNGVFSRCENLTTVCLPNSLVEISDHAFSNCKKLTSITIPDGVTSIGDGAFSDCESLNNVTIPDGVTSIGDGAFRHCDSLNNVIIPERVNSIGKYAFSSCDSLTSITLQNPNGWQTPNGTAIESSILSDPASAAKYLNEDCMTALQRN